MLWMLVAVCAAAALYLVALISFIRYFAAMPLAWRLLAWSGVPLALSGFGFATRFWTPSPGPYVANSLYPFGGHLQAWAVSFGFTWAAYGLLFTGAVLLVARQASRRSWSLLLASWLLCVWPHAIIAISFAWNGANEQSARVYGRWWASNPVARIVLVSGAVLTLWHFTFVIAGFIATGLSVWKEFGNPSHQ
jgi:hypothetical protein